MINVTRRRCVLVFFAALFGAGGVDQTAKGQAQELAHTGRRDSLLRELESLRDGLGLGIQDRGKCGLGFRMEILSQLEQTLRTETDRAIRLFSPPFLQKDTVMGHFRIHYDTSGVNVPAMLDSAGQRRPGTAREFIDSVGRYFNEAWDSEVYGLGYEAPPLMPGTSGYDIYVISAAFLGSGVYGATTPWPFQPVNSDNTAPRYTSYVEINNDFAGFYTRGMRALKVTAAHEFHHAIQIGSYGIWSSDIYFYEITSTWMEDVVYDEVNDYYQYLRSLGGAPRGHFDTPQRALSATGNLIEYSRVIWAKYIEKRFSREAMRTTWENMRHESSLPALNRMLRDKGSSLPEAYLEFSLWNSFTGQVADTVNYYPEGRNYPSIRIQDSLVFQYPLSVFTNVTGLASLGSCYYRLYLDAARTSSVTAIVAKTNIAEASGGAAEAFQFSIRGDDPGDENFRLFTVDRIPYWFRISGVRTPADWSGFFSTDSTVLLPTVLAAAAYPNPFYVGDHGWIRFEIPGISPGSLLILSSNMDLVYSDEQGPQSTLVKSSFFKWNGHAQNGEEVASGVYIYVVVAGGQEYVGKFLVIRK